MHLHKPFLFTLISITLITLAACQSQPISSGSSNPTTEDSAITTGRGAGDVLKLLSWQAASTMNPYLSGGTKEREASSLALEPLARYDENGDLVPWLVNEIPTLENGGISEDLTTITWKLKEGILWSDGTPLTADDVVFTADYCMDEKTGCIFSSHFNNVERVEALDELTIRITFEQPKPFPYGAFVSSLSPILQKAQFADCTGEKAQQCTEENFAPIGTGPYKVKEFKANDTALFEINENYRESDKPFFKEVILKGGGAAAGTARAVLKNGEADYATNMQVQPEILQEMESHGKGKVMATFGSAVERLQVNLSNPDPALGESRSDWSPDNPNPHPFLSDHAVRQALSLAIDRTVIANQLYGAGGQPTCNLVPAPDIYASPNNNCDQDIDQANAILDEAGWLLGEDGIREKDGVRLSILYQTSTNSVRQNTQALIKKWWEEIGVETELRNIEASVFFGSDPASPDTYQKFYADIEMFYSGFDGADPGDSLTDWSCEQITSSANQWSGPNVSRWCNQEYDDLLVKLAETSGIEERAKIVIKINDVAIQDYAIIPLIHRGTVSARGNTLEGVKLNAWDSEFWNIADWTRKQ